MPTQAYRLPNFLAFLPKKPGGGINPHFQEVETSFNAWMERMLGRSVVEDVREIPLATAMSYPVASSQQLRCILDYFGVCFLLDDLIDRISSKETPSLAQLWLNSLRDGSEVENVQHPIIEVMRREIIPGTRAIVGSFHWPQFVAANEESVAQMAQEGHDRNLHLHKHAALDIQSYVKKRRLTVGARVCFVFIRCTRGLYIPNDVLAHSITQEIESAITEMLYIVNDVLSFKKEYGFNGAFHNILTVIRNDPVTAHLDFQGRLDYAGELFKAAAERFHACRRELPSFIPEVDQYLTLYVDGLIDLIVGSTEWSLANCRYNTFTNEEDKANNVTRLALE